MKSFQGPEFDELLAMVRKRFYSVRVVSVAATRTGSRECYIVAKNFIGDARDDRVKKEDVEEE